MSTVIFMHGTGIREPVFFPGYSGGSRASCADGGPNLTSNRVIGEEPKVPGCGMAAAPFQAMTPPGALPPTPG
jgi:hypothetical protein